MSLVKSVVGSVLGSVGDMGNTALENRGARDVARINEADDVTTSGFNQEVLQQLQQALSKVDKQTLEKLTGSTITDEQMRSFQNQVGSTATTTKGTASSTGTTDVAGTKDVTGTTSTTGAEKTTQTTQRGNAVQQGALDQLIGSLSGGNAGNADFDAAMRQVLRSGMPAMANVGNNSGTFDSTTAALLQQDLAIKAADAGLQAQNQVKQQQNAQLLEALKVGQAGTETVVGDLQRQQQEQMAQKEAMAQQERNAQQQQMTQQENQATQMQTATDQTNKSNQQTTQDRQSSETGTTSTNTSNTSVGTTVNQQFQDVAKDTSTPPTYGPIADVIAGRAVTPVAVNPLATATPAGPVAGPGGTVPSNGGIPSPGTGGNIPLPVGGGGAVNPIGPVIAPHMAGNQVAAALSPAVANPGMAMVAPQVVQPAVAQPGMQSPTTKQMFMDQSLGPMIGADGGNPVAAAIGGVPMTTGSNVAPNVNTMVRMNPMGGDLAQVSAQASAVPNQQLATPGNVAQLNPISQAITGKVDPYMTDPIMAPLPVTERRAVI